MRNYFPSIRPERAAYLVHFSVKHRFLYVETPKVACSTIKRMLQRIVGIAPQDVHDRSQSPLCSPLTDAAGFLEAQASDYLRFSFVRNPFTRILSCYLDKFVTNSFERARLLPELGLKSDADLSFTDFLEAVQSQTYYDMDIHWLPQSVILEGLVKPAFIGRFENIRADMASVLAAIGSHEEAQPFRPHATDAGAKVAEYLTPEALRLILEIYEQDFIQFSYSPDPRFAS